MRDKDFELATERSLVLPENYFARYREHLAECQSGSIAWLKTEADLFAEAGVGRYSSLDTFRHGLARERDIIASPQIWLRRK